MSSKHTAAGTVVLDTSGRVLLRAPTNAFGGYRWTFAKGRIHDNETSRDAAIRETREETGLDVRIVASLGLFAGDTSVTEFFIAVPLAVVGVPDKETEAVGWFTIAAAKRYILMTTTEQGRMRDIAVLGAARRAAAFHASLAHLDSLDRLRA